MKKILLSILTIAVVVSLTVGAAYAYFTSSAASLTGITLASATPALQISVGSGWVTAAVGTSEYYMYPGWEGVERTFWLRNSTGGGVPFAKVIPTISTHSGNWDKLKYEVEIEFAETGAGWGNNWHTLNYWSTNTSVNILGFDLGDGVQRQISMHYRMKPSAGDSAKGMAITGLQWDFVARTP